MVILSVCLSVYRIVSVSFVAEIAEQVKIVHAL